MRTIAIIAVLGACAGCGLDDKFKGATGGDDLAVGGTDDMGSDDMSGADLSPPPPDMVATDLAQNITMLTWDDQSASIPSGAVLTAVFALSDTDVYFGDFGAETVRHWDGNSTWTTMLNNGTVFGSISSLWAFSTSDVYATSQGGVWHYNGSSFTKTYTASGGAYPEALWGYSAAYVRAVGSSSLSLLSTNGGTSFSTGDPYSGELTAVWGPSQTEHYVGTGGGDVAHEGGAGGAGLTKETNVANVRINKIWGTSAGSVWAVGSTGTVLHSSGNGQWQAATLGVPGTAAIQTIWGPSADDLFIGGTNGTFMQSTNQGLSWVAVAGSNLPTDGQVMGIWGTSKTDVWVLYRATSNGTKIFHGH